MEAPLNIEQFNALLHSKKDQNQLFSALYTLTTISDLDLFVNSLNPLAGWSGWH